MDITYLRASMTLINWSGAWILTDPWFAMHMRGLPVFVKPALRASELPPLDLVLVSHLHPDHFDPAGLSMLAGPCQALIGPPQMAGRADRVPHVHEHCLNDDDTIYAGGGFRVKAFSVAHSGYENAYLVERAGASLFFAGDAKYNSVFAMIGAQHRPMVSLLPVGGTIALGRRIVMNPADAAKAAVDLKTRVVVPIHHGGEWLSVPPLSFHPGRAAHLETIAADDGAPYRVLALAPGETGTVTDDELHSETDPVSEEDPA